MFTATEKQQIDNLYNKVITPIMACYSNELYASVREAQDTEAILKPAIQAVVECLREASFCFTYLMNGNGLSSFTPPVATDRSSKLVNAWFHLDRVTMFANQAITILSQAKGVNAGRARTIWLPQVINGVKTIDRTLPYLDPQPNPNGTLIGPHGDFYKSEWHIWRAWWYLMDMVESANSFYSLLGPNLGTVIAKAGVIFSICARGMSRFADIDVTDKEKQIRTTLTNVFGQQFFLLLGYGEALTTHAPTPGAPEFFHELQDAIATAPAELATARVRITDSWRHLDQAVWHSLLEFPGCNMQDDPAGCAAKLPSQQPVIKEILPTLITASIEGQTAIYTKS